MITNFSDDWEPEELQILKKQLGNLNCQCKTCEKSRRHFLLRKPPVCDIGVQAENECKKSVLKVQEVKKKEEKDARCSVGNCKWESTICPSCFISMHLLRMGLPKTMKDVETEAKMSCGCNLKKEVIDNATSFTFDDIVVPESSDCSKHCIIYSNNPRKEVSFEIKQERCIELDDFMNAIRPDLAYD